MTPSGPAPRIGLFGLLGGGNIGNDGSTAAVLAHLRSAHPGAQVSAFCTGAAVVAERYGVPVTPMHRWASYSEDGRDPAGPALRVLGKVADAVRTYRWVRRQDAVVVPGAGVLEATLPIRPWGFPLSLLVLTVCGRLTGTRVALVDVGAEMIVSPATRQVVTTAARLATHRSYRDEHSRAAMHRMGVDTSGDEVGADLTFALPVPPHRDGDRSGVVGVGVMDWHGASEDRRRAAAINTAYLAAMRGFVGHLLDDGRRVRFLIGDAVDLPVAQRLVDDVLAERAGRNRTLVEVESVRTLEELVERMSDLDVVVATRYHNIVAALRLGKPTLALSYAAKADAVMSEMGLGGFCHPARFPELDRLLVLFAELEERHDVLAATVRANVATTTDRLQTQLKGLAADLLPPTSAPVPGRATRARAVAGAVKDVGERLLTAVGLGEPPAKLAADARAYWRAADRDGRWHDDSHWRDADVFDGNDLWAETGREHLRLFRQLAGSSDPLGTVLEWGCGGGANAVAFAPEASEFVAVDIAPASVDECCRQVGAVCETPIRPLPVDPDRPEEVVPALRGQVDLFLSVYVFELVVSKDYGARLLRVARDVLRDGGLAMIQIKYDTGGFATAARTRNYRSRLASMTTYRIDEFWELAAGCGLTPKAVHLVPRNDLDERYAYFLLSRDGGTPGEVIR